MFDEKHTTQSTKPIEWPLYNDVLYDIIVIAIFRMITESQ